MGDRPTERFDGDPSSRPTERFDEASERATERFAEGGETRATARFGGEEGAAAPRIAHPSSLGAGDVVADRYEILEGPIGEPTGEAEVYRCADRENGQVFALKVYHDKAAPKEAVLQSLLSMRHPDVIALHGYGTWAGRLYEVMDYCAGGSLADHMPIGEAELRVHLREIARGLRYLHEAGIIHRDIKPNNMFFRGLDKENLVIGDFGVSSMLEAPGKVRRTTTAGFFTLDFAAPELIDGKEVGPKTDYYALGVTLLHLLEGRSPFAGMDRNTVLGCHFRGAVPRPKTLSPEFARLINGLLRVEPSLRWGYRQVTAWLRGEPVLTDNGLPDHETAAAGKRIPYRSLPAITTPREMARRLGEFDVAKDLLRGFVSQWLMLFDTKLGAQAAALEEEFSDNIELGVFKLRYVLDPTLPLEIGSLQLVSVAQMVEALSAHTIPCRDEFGKALFSGCIEVWLAALGNTPEIKSLSLRVASLRRRVSDIDLGLFALLHTLDPARPLRLGSSLVRTPEDLPEAIERTPGISMILRRYLFKGWIAEWLRASFPDRREDLLFVEKCAEVHQNKDSELAYFCLRCHFDPDTPIRVGSALARSPEELAAALSQTPAMRQQGIRLLRSGHIRSWLVFTGRLKEPAPLDEVIIDPVASWERKLESVLQLLDPGIGKPVVMADAEELDGGTVTTEGGKTLNLLVFNGGRGHLSGSVTLATESTGFMMVDHQIEGEPVELAIHLVGQGLDPGTIQEARVVVETNGGNLSIPVRFEVSRPGWRVLGRSLWMGALAGFLAGFFRLTLQAVDPQKTPGLLPWADTRQPADLLRMWSYVPLLLLLATVLLAVVYFALRIYQRSRDEWGDFADGIPEVEEPEERGRFQ